MTPYKSEIYRKLEAVLAEADSAQIARLLNDIATGQFSETSQTRAGTNDCQTNVTALHDRSGPHASGTVDRSTAQLSAASRDARRRRYSS